MRSGQTARRPLAHVELMRVHVRRGEAARNNSDDVIRAGYVDAARHQQPGHPMGDNRAPSQERDTRPGGRRRPMRQWASQKVHHLAPSSK